MTTEPTPAYCVVYRDGDRLIGWTLSKTQHCAELSVSPFEGMEVVGVLAGTFHPMEPMQGMEFAIARHKLPEGELLTPDAATLIAELGQEVGAVEPAWFYVRTPGADYDYTFTKTREEAIDLQDCDEPDEPIPLYAASPAHTSDARDAQDALEWLGRQMRTSTAYMDGSAAFNAASFAMRKHDLRGRTFLEAVISAMRQEAE